MEYQIGQRLYILGYTTRHHEFAVADAINDIGALAISPREVNMVRLPKQRRPQPVETPVLGNYLFCAMTPEQWHQVHNDNRIAFTSLREIEQKEWLSVQKFAQRIEADYQFRMAQIERGQRIEEYAVGDIIEILGGPLLGTFATFARVIETDLWPVIEVQSELLGKMFMARVDPINARPLQKAAE